MDALQHFDQLYGDIGPSPQDAAMLHKPRFYAPVYWLKNSWGWKRKCEDFVKKEQQ